MSFPFRVTSSAKESAIYPRCAPWLSPSYPLASAHSLCVTKLPVVLLWPGLVLHKCSGVSMSDRLLFQYRFINLLIAAPRSSQCLLKFPLFPVLVHWVILHSFIHSFARQAFIEHLWRTSLCFRCSGRRGALEGENKSWSSQSLMLVEERDRLCLIHSEIVSHANISEIAMNFTFHCCWVDSAQTQLAFTACTRVHLAETLTPSSVQLQFSWQLRQRLNSITL